MALFRRVFRINQRFGYAFCSTQAKPDDQDIKDEEFRVLELYPMKKTGKKTSREFFNPPTLPPREKSMPIDQDWPSVWPTPKTFRPSSVPLPVYQGYSQKKAAPGKYANAELMKIPNFLHLTPPAIKRHCEAIKKFCTEWPKGLETDEDCQKHFPLEVITADYCHSSPTIRDERSRIVTLKIKLESLNLDYHAKDKILRLIGPERYDSKTDTMIIVADRCPLRKQNYDYLMYLLSALYHESQIFEPWESEKSEADMEKFFFKGSRLETHICETVKFIRSATRAEDMSLEEIKSSKEVCNYSNCVTDLINEGESDYTIQRYKEAVLNILGITVLTNEVHQERLP